MLMKSTLGLIVFGDEIKCKVYLYSRVMFVECKVVDQNNQKSEQQQLKVKTENALHAYPVNPFVVALTSNITL